MVDDERIHFRRGPLTTVVGGSMIWFVLHALDLSLEAELRFGVVEPLNFERRQVCIMLRKYVAAVDARVVVLHPRRRAPRRNQILVHTIARIHALKPPHATLNARGNPVILSNDFLR